MNRQHLLFSLLVLLLVVLSAGLWLKLRKERVVIEELRAQLSAASSPDVTPLAEEPSAMVVPPRTVVAVPGACPPVVAPATMPTEEFIARMETLLARIPESISNVLREPELVDDPEYRQARLIQMRISEARDNPGLVEALGLTDAEARNLFELMAAHQLEVTLERSSAPGGVPSLDAMMETVQRVGVAHEQSMRALLGNEKYPRLVEYRAILRPAYIQVANVERTLLSAGQPLADAQSRALKAALLQAQRKPRPPPAVDSSRPVSIISISQARKADNERRVLEISEAHLSAAQLETLRRSFDSQASASR